jgi:histidyl-tRNA synthetase
VGGGRYDKLTEAFGRKDIGATGVAGGVERIVMALRLQGSKIDPNPNLIYVACIGEAERFKALEVSSGLREAGFATEYDLIGKSLRKQLEDAAAKNADVALIVGPEEVASGTIILRHLKEGKEEKLRLEGLNDALKKILKA